MATEITLAEFYAGCSVGTPSHYESMRGTVTGNEFTVTNHPDIYFPMRDPDGAVIYWETIPADYWKHRIFIRRPELKKATGKRKFLFGAGK
jgi:hypothetical protein